MKRHRCRRVWKASLKDWKNPNDHRALSLLIQFREHEDSIRHARLPESPVVFEPDFDLSTMTSIAWAHGETACRIAIRREEGRILNFTALPQPPPLPRHY